MKLELDFVKCNPVHNMTILVKTEYPVEQHLHIASQMMAYHHLYAEQVGFVEKASRLDCAARLQMAGGEFCGNACMSLAAYLAAEQNLPEGGKTEFALEASGAAMPVHCQVKQDGGAYICEVEMPVPERLERASVSVEGRDIELGIVRYRDSFHAIIEVEHVDHLARAMSERLARLLGIASGGSLVGIMLYRSASNELLPLIYVPALNSMIWEQGCGSGTASLGAYLAWSRQQNIAIPIRQPGGCIHVIAACSNGQISSLRIKSSVSIVAQGRAYVDDNIQNLGGRC